MARRIVNADEVAARQVVLAGGYSEKISKAQRAANRSAAIEAGLHIEFDPCESFRENPLYGRTFLGFGSIYTDLNEDDDRVNRRDTESTREPMYVYHVNDEFYDDLDSYWYETVFEPFAADRYELMDKSARYTVPQDREPSFEEQYFKWLSDDMCYDNRSRRPVVVSPLVHENGHISSRTSMRPKTSAIAYKYDAHGSDSRARKLVHGLKSHIGRLPGQVCSIKQMPLHEEPQSFLDYLYEYEKFVETLYSKEELNNPEFAADFENPRYDPDSYQSRYH